MSGSSSYSDSDSESSVEFEDVEDDLYALELEKHKQQAPPTINDELGLKQKLQEIKLRIKGYEPDQIPWSEVLVLTSDKSTQAILDDADDDLKREKVFYDQAVEAIINGLERLDDEGVPYERPDDYYAEMIKTDEHMKTVKGVLLREKRLIDEAVERRKNRTSKKYAKQTQLQAKQQRKAQKDAELDAVKKWRKNQKKSGGGEDFPEEMLESKPRRQPLQRNPSGKAAAKNAKYGYGGKKRGQKKNSADTAASTSGWSTARNKTVDSEFKNKLAHHKGSKGTKGGASRPGKRKRQQQSGGPNKRARK